MTEIQVFEGDGYLHEVQVYCHSLTTIAQAHPAWSDVRLEFMLHWLCDHTADKLRPLLWKSIGLLQISTVRHRPDQFPPGGSSFVNVTITDLLVHSCDVRLNLRHENIVQQYGYADVDWGV